MSNLWTGLTVEEVRELIAFSAAQLKRVHALRAEEEQHPAWRRNPALMAEIKAWNRAHDLHWEWLSEIEARETWKPRKSPMG